MYCNQCGNEIKKGQCFCTKCGNKIENNIQETKSNIDKFSNSGNYKKVIIVLVVIAIISIIAVTDKKPSKQDTLIAINDYVRTTIRDNTDQKGIHDIEYRILGTDNNNRQLYEIKYKHATSNVFGKKEELLDFCWVLTKDGKPISCYYGPTNSYSNLDEWKRKNNWIDYNSK